MLNNIVDTSLISCKNGYMKHPAPFFLSYAHADSPDVNRFLHVLRPLLKTSADYDFSEWNDHHILPGEMWREEIEQALTRKFGILLVSPQFLASSFITAQELPVLLAKPMVVPVGLHQILFDGSIDLKGLADRQLFRDSKNRTFDGCGRITERRDFARELFTQITALLKKNGC